MIRARSGGALGGADVAPASGRWYASGVPYLPRKCRHCAEWFAPASPRQFQCALCYEITEAEWWAEHGFPDRAEQLPAMRAAQQKRKRDRRPPIPVEEVDPRQTAELAARVKAWKTKDPARLAVLESRIIGEHYARFGLGVPLDENLHCRAILVRLGETCPPAQRALEEDV